MISMVSASVMNMWFLSPVNLQVSHPSFHVIFDFPCESPSFGEQPPVTVHNPCIPP